MGLVCLVSITLRRVRWRELQRIAVNESGAGYTLSYVMCLPFLVLLIAALIECSLLLIVKVGTVYAAYAAGRSAAVWQTATPNELVDKARLAAVQAMVPFASSNPAHNPRGENPSASYFAYRSAYSRYARKPVADAYLRAKYAYAQFATKVNVTPATDFNGDIVVSLTYEMPFHTLGVGRLFGRAANWNPTIYTVAIRSEAIVQNEGPRPPSHKLGIVYESR